MSKRYEFREALRAIDRRWRLLGLFAPFDVDAAQFPDWRATPDVLRVRLAGIRLAALGGSEPFVKAPPRRRFY